MYNNSPAENTRYRLDALREFERARVAARWHWLRAKLKGQAFTLMSFSQFEKWLPQQRRYKGIREIPLNDIVGSINRSREYSRQFHPLQAAQKERWVSMMMLSQSRGWEAIQVYKVANLYFVVDGHHRVSVARQLKNPVIEAEVWEYRLGQDFDAHRDPDLLLQQLRQWNRLEDAPLVYCDLLG